jgi:hypothetical protein
MKPEAQEQMKLLGDVTVQVAPFRHGMLVHGVITGDLIKEPVIN